jgi:hypothetical protein
VITAIKSFVVRFIFANDTYFTDVVSGTHIQNPAVQVSYFETSIIV